MTPMEGTVHHFGPFRRRIFGQDPAAPCSPGPFVLLLNFSEQLRLIPSGAPGLHALFGANFRFDYTYTYTFNCFEN